MLISSLSTTDGGGDLGGAITANKAAKWATGVRSQTSGCFKGHLRIFPSIFVQEWETNTGILNLTRA